jgi:2-aminoethylphosphonate-pyruvate transaminase
MEELLAIGFVPFLRPEHRSPIITPFRYPLDPQFSFERFYSGLSRRGFVIYPGKLKDEERFRIGNSAISFPKIFAAWAPPSARCSPKPV